MKHGKETRGIGALHEIGMEGYMRSFRRRPKYGNNRVAQEHQEKIEAIGNGEVLGECDTRFWRHRRVCDQYGGGQDETVSLEHETVRLKTLFGENTKIWKVEQLSFIVGRRAVMGRKGVNYSHLALWGQPSG